MQSIPWFERKFDFNFAPEYLPSILARLRGTPARLEELMRGGSGRRAIAKNQDSWSAQEHAGHLKDMEPLWLTRVEDYAAGRASLTAADLQNRRTHEANHNARPVEEILLGFRLARMALLKRIAQLEPAIMTQTLPHPRMQTPMRLIDHLYFVAEHDDHHLAHIHELLLAGE